MHHTEVKVTETHYKVNINKIEYWKYLFKRRIKVLVIAKFYFVLCLRLITLKLLLDLVCVTTTLSLFEIIVGCFDQGVYLFIYLIQN